MITYLRSGWYSRVGRKRLRSDVIDGAIDAASMLYQAGVSPRAVTRVALQVRTLATLVDPPHRQRLHDHFHGHERDTLAQRLAPACDRYPPLLGFVTDCLEHVHGIDELRALYLHLVHISQMMQLLAVASLAGAQPAPHRTTRAGTAQAGTTTGPTTATEGSTSDAKKPTPAKQVTTKAASTKKVKVSKKPPAAKNKKKNKKNKKKKKATKKPPTARKKKKATKKPPAARKKATRHALPHNAGVANHLRR